MRDGGWMNKSSTDSKFLNDIVVDDYEHWAIWSFFKEGIVTRTIFVCEVMVRGCDDGVYEKVKAKILVDGLAKKISI